MGSKTAWRPPDCGTLWGESPEKARGSVKLAGLGESIPEVWRLCRDLPLAGVQLLGEGGGRRPPERLEENPSCSGVQARQGGGERPVLLENTLRHAARGREGHVTSRGEGGGGGGADSRLAFAVPWSLWAWKLCSPYHSSVTVGELLGHSEPRFPLL